MALSNEDIREYSRRLLLSRMRILCNHGFFGLLLMHMRFSVDEKVETACTDGEFITFGTDFLSMLSDSELDFVMMHEIMHVALRHCLRGQDLDPQIFNIACDIVVNSNLLLENGMNERSITLRAFGDEASMHIAPNGKEGHLYTAEEVYAMLTKDQKSRKSKARAAAATTATATAAVAAAKIKTKAKAAGKAKVVGKVKAMRKVKAKAKAMRKAKAAGNKKTPLKADRAVTAQANSKAAVDKAKGKAKATAKEAVHRGTKATYPAHRKAVAAARRGTTIAAGAKKAMTASFGRSGKSGSPMWPRPSPCALPRAALARYRFLPSGF